MLSMKQEAEETYEDMTIYQALFGEVKPNDDTKISREFVREDHRRSRSSNAKKKNRDERTSSDLSFNFYGQHNGEAPLSNSGSTGFAARKHKSGKGRRISRSPGRPIPPARHNGFCCLFGPYVAVLILLILAQAASFLFLYHQVDVMRHNYYEQYKVIHQHMASLMSEFRYLKTNMEYTKSIDKLSNMYNRDEQDVINDDEEYDPQFSGYSRYPSEIFSQENVKNDHVLKKIDLRKFESFDYYFDNDELSGDSEIFDDFAFLNGTKNALETFKSFRASNEKVNETFKESALPSRQEPPIRNVTTDSNVPLPRDGDMLELSRKPRSARNKHQVRRRRFRSLRRRNPNDAPYFLPHVGLSPDLHSLVNDDRNTIRKSRRRRGRGASKKESAVYPAVEASYGASLSRADTSASHRGARFNRLSSARGRKTSYNSPVIDAPRAPAHNRGYGEAFGYRSYDSVADNSYRSGLQPGGYQTSTHKRDHESASRVLPDDRNKRLQNDHDRNLLLQTTAARPSASNRPNNIIRSLDAPQMAEYSRSLNADTPFGPQNDKADSNSGRQPNLLSGPGIRDTRHSYVRSHNPRVSESHQIRAPSFPIAGIQNDQATHDEVAPGDQSDATPDEGQEEDDVDSSWLQLTSYSKIPYDAIEEFCSRTRSSCPPGPAGPMGLEGAKGSRGDKGELGAVGPKGDMGPVGPQGLTGPPGPAGRNGRKGDMGVTGMTGLDGRDGLPGEPGLDGIPGRNGLDGIPGVDGIPGFDGLPGRDGRNGTDGAEGAQGMKGDTGDQGPRGLPGPRGRAGKSGRAGTPGIPGITTWKVNGTSPRHLLIPPAIPGPTTSTAPGSLVVHEGDHVRLRCAATGVPSPRVEWRRLDDNAIPTGRWKDASVNDPVLNLTHVRRDHTGSYSCEAYNGVPPNAFKIFKLEVHFQPFIQVKEWKVGAFNGSSARMECRVESYPTALTYWENRHGQLLENSDKFRVYNVPHSNFVWRSTLVLLINNITGPDYGSYYCIAKNELAVTRGTVELHEIDPRRYKPSTGATGGVSFGPEAPNYSELFGDLCPPPPVCDECPPPPAPVHDSGFLYCLNIGQFGNDTYPGFSNRTLGCKLSAIGKPVFNRHTSNDYGSWLRDPLPRNKFYEPHYYSTQPDEPRRLFEFDSKEKFRQNEPSKNYSLPFPFTGNSHVVYNGSFYYHEANSSNVIRYDLISKTVKFQPLPLLTPVGGNYLYTETRDHLDLSVDENGLWAIYGLPKSNNTVVVKLEPLSLTIEYSWNISLNHHKFGEMFITCGVLYGIDSSTERETKIRFALDLYTNKVLDVDLKFTNPFRKTTALGYNPRAKEIYSWDSGNQLNYPVVYIDIGYDAPDEDLGVLSVPDYDQDYEVVRQNRRAPDGAVRNQPNVKGL